MIFSSSRQRYQNSRKSDCTEFGNGYGTGSRNHHVGNTVCQFHSIYEIRTPDGIPIVIIQLFFGSGQIGFPNLPNHKTPCIHIFLQVFGNRIVNCKSSLTSADNEHNRFASVFNSEILECLISFRCYIQKLFSDWITGHDYFLLREKFFQTTVSHTYSIHILAQHYIGFARKRILFLYYGRNMLRNCRFQNGTTCISTDSDNKIRLKVLNNLFCLLHAQEELYKDRYVFQHRFSAKSLHIKPDNLIPGLRDFFHFHSSVGTYEENVGIRISVPYSICNCYCRKYMPSCSTPTDNNLNSIIILHKQPPLLL